MQNNYFIQNMKERIKRGDYTYFLLKEEADFLQSLLKKENIFFQIYKTHEQAEKVIFYKKKKPKISIYEIKAESTLSHSKIMGTLYAHSIKKEMYGDILTFKKNYLFLFSSIEDYILQNIHHIGGEKVSFEKVKFSDVEEYKQSFKILHFSLSSNRMDLVLAKLLKLSRKQVEMKFKEKEILLNGKIQVKNNVFLKEKDTFSIRKYGKYIYEEELKHKDRYFITIKKYN